MIVCTLCSCYPWEMLGLPPVWYKSAPYRSRAVKDPRGVLADFGVDAAARYRDPGVGFHRRDPLHRAAHAAGRHRRLERGEARRTGDARCDDRHRARQAPDDRARHERAASATIAIAECLAAQMADAETQWSLGTFGAIAEFARDPDEAADLRYGATHILGDHRPRRHTHHAACRYAPVRIRDHDQGKLEPPRGTLPAAGALRHEPPCGADRARARFRGAARRRPRAAFCSISGIDALQIDACVRVSDPAVAAQLRAYCGQPTFAPGNPAAGLLLAHSPHRVFVSRIGRIEVYQPIPPRPWQARKARTPTFCSTCCATGAPMRRPSRFPKASCLALIFIPPTRQRTRRAGAGRSIRAATPLPSHAASFGDPKSVALKQRVLAAVAAGEDLQSFRSPTIASRAPMSA